MRRAQQSLAADGAIGYFSSNFYGSSTVNRAPQGQRSVVSLKIMETLPEFRVMLTRLQQGETAYPTDGPHYENQGQRTKLGGDPDWVQSEDVPLCPDCDELMSFVAQIDSVEHQWRSNPHSVDALSDNQKWMFGDVGMIYVFFCFDCCTTSSVFQCG